MSSRNIFSYSEKKKKEKAKATAKENFKDINKVIFNTKKDDSNTKFQSYSPLPKNLGFPLNKNNNKLIYEDIRPTDTRNNYKSI